MATSGSSGISPLAVERPACPAPRHPPIAGGRAWYNALSCAGHAEPVSHAHQLGDRFRPHLAHHLPSVDLHGDELSPSSAAICLFTVPRRRRHDLPLALSELVVSASAPRGSPPRAPARRARSPHRSRPAAPDRERLGEKLDRAGLHRTHGHRNVAVPGDEDDRESDTCFRDLVLKRQSAHARQPHVEHEAARCVGPLRLHEFAAEEKRRASRPTDLRRPSSDRRMDGSSSTTRDYCALAHDCPFFGNREREPEDRPMRAGSRSPKAARRAPRRSSG